MSLALKWFQLAWNLSALQESEKSCLLVFSTTEVSSPRLRAKENSDQHLVFSSSGVFETYQIFWVNFLKENFFFLIH